MSGGLLEKSAFNLGGIRVAIKGSVGQQMPDDDQDLARDDGDGFLSAFVGFSKRLKQQSRQ